MFIMKGEGYIFNLKYAIDKSKLFELGGGVVHIKFVHLILYIESSKEQQLSFVTLKCLSLLINFMYA